MAELPREQRWAARLVAVTLDGVFVHPRGDAAAQGQDFDIERNGDVFAALRVAAAADEEALALWRLVNDSDDTWVDPSLAAGWTVSLLPYARAGTVRHRLPALLASLEEQRRSVLRIEDAPADAEVSEARRIGVAAADQGRVPTYPGSILLTVEHPGSPADRAADAADQLVFWISSWLHALHRLAELADLGRSRVPERHLFVVVPGFTTAPDAVVNLLFRDDPELPSKPPDLPGPLTHLWVASTWATGLGLRWAPDTGWQFFHKL